MNIKKKITSLIMASVIGVSTFLPIMQVSAGGSSGGGSGSITHGRPGGRGGVIVRKEAYKSKITIHKLKYNNDLASDKLIKNDGTEKTPDPSITPYDAAVYGKVGFTLYMLDKQKVIEELQKEGGNAQKVADKIASDIPGNTTKGLIIDPTSSPGVVPGNGPGVIVRGPAVDITGPDVSSDDESGNSGADSDPRMPVASDPSEVFEDNTGKELFQTGTTPIVMEIQTAGNEYYLLVETTSPKNTVVAKAQPMLIELPMKNAEGTGFLTDVHLYPKNKVDDNKRKAKFTKLLITDYGTGTKENLEGAKFEVLYSKEAPESDSGYQNLTKDGQKVIVTSGPKGEFEIADLKVGYYILKEINTDKIQVLGQDKVEGAKILAPKDRLIHFSYEEDGSITQDSDEIDNYTTTVTEKTIKTNNPEYGKTLEYTVKLRNIPASLFSGADTKIVVEDTVTEGLKILKDTIQYKGSEGDFKNIPAEYVKQEDTKTNQVKIELPLGDMTLQPNPKNLNDISGVEFKYQVQVTKDYKYEENKVIKNTVKSKYVDGDIEYIPPTPDTPGKPGEPPTNVVESPVYEQAFKKKDSGLWNTGVGEAGLQGAEFIIMKFDGEKYVYRADDAETKYKWVEDKSQAHKYVSGEDGTFTVEGLASVDDKGTPIRYAAIEVKAPGGYVLPQQKADRVHVFTVGAEGTVESDENEENGIITINNDKSVDAPMTGYEKSTLALGAMVVLVSVAAVLSKNKKKTTDK